MANNQSNNPYVQMYEQNVQNIASALRSSYRKDGSFDSLAWTKELEKLYSSNQQLVAELRKFGEQFEKADKSTTHREERAENRFLKDILKSFKLYIDEFSNNRTISQSGIRGGKDTNKGYINTLKTANSEGNQSLRTILSEVKSISTDIKTIAQRDYTSHFAELSSNLGSINTSIQSLSTSISDVQQQVQTNNTNVSNQINQTMQHVQHQLNLMAMMNHVGNQGQTTQQAQEEVNQENQRQNGFINRLIPRLARLLGHNPMTDLLRWGFLLLGQNHPVLASAGILGLPLLARNLGGLNRGIQWLGRTPLFRKLPTDISFRDFRRAKSHTPAYYDNRVTLGTQALARKQARIDNFHTNGFTNLADQRNYDNLIKGRARLERAIARNQALGQLSGAENFASLNRLRAVRNIFRGAPLLGSIIGVLADLPDIMKARRENRLGRQLAQTGGGIAGAWAGAQAGAGLGATIGTFAGPIGTAIGGAIGAVVGAVLGSWLGRLLGRVLGEIGAFVGRGFQQFREGIQNGLAPAINRYREATEQLHNAFANLRNTVGQALQPALNAISSRFNQFGNAIADVFGRVNNVLRNGFLSTCEKVGRILGRIPDSLTNMVNSITGFVNWITDWLPGGSRRNLQEHLQDAGRADNYKRRKEYFDRVTANPTSRDIRGRTEKDKVLDNYRDEYYRNKAREENIPEFMARFRYGKSGEADKYARTRWDNYVSSERAWLAREGKALQLNDVINGVSAVHLGSLDLEGGIGKRNSKPYIAQQNVERLKELDSLLAGWGVKFDYTSAMGGAHAGGARSHGAGAKVDLVLRNGGRLTRAQEDELERRGFFGNGTGAVGYHDQGDGYHYDLSVLARGARAITPTGVVTEGANINSATSSSEVYKKVMERTGGLNGDEKQSTIRNLVFSATDVTGSLGVWGITHNNNTGRPKGA